MPFDINGNILTDSQVKYYNETTVIRDGLVMYLDADSPESYPGSGTNWYDLSNNNNNGVLNGGITYTTNSGYGIGIGQTECTEDSPLNPISVYGTTKCAAENYLRSQTDAITFRLEISDKYSNFLRIFLSRGSL